MLEIGQNIYHARLQRSVSQEQLSMATGILQPNLSRIEKGKQDITVSTLVRIALSLNMKPSQLLGESPALPEEGKPYIHLTRPVIEKIAAAVTGSPARLDLKERELVKWLQAVVRLPGKRPLSVKRTYQAWSRLKSSLNNVELRILLERVRDATQRMK
jgi:transcriptional regulator with XRE-family HTH domain